MCKCKDDHWCRTWEETQDGKYPIAEHAPGCDEYKSEEFTVLEHDETKCVMEPKEAAGVLAEENECDYTVSTVMLTRDQFEKIPEFLGF